KGSARGIAAKRFSAARTPAAFVRGVTISTSSGTAVSGGRRLSVIDTVPSRERARLVEEDPGEEPARLGGPVDVPELADHLGELLAGAALPGPSGAALGERDRRVAGPADEVAVAQDGLAERGASRALVGAGQGSAKLHCFSPYVADRGWSKVA